MNQPVAHQAPNSSGLQRQLGLLGLAATGI